MTRDELRIRYVLNDPRGEVVCLNDVVMAFANTSEKFRHLEYKDSVHSFREARKAFNLAKKKMKEFEERMQNEIKEDIMKAVSKVDKRVDPKKPESFNSFLED